jgi:hypothetical protein
MKRFSHYHEVDFRATPIRRAESASDAARALAQTKRTGHFQTPFAMHRHVRIGTNVTI